MATVARFGGLWYGGGWGRRVAHGWGDFGAWWGIVVATAGRENGREHCCSRPSSSLRLHTQLFREGFAFRLGFQGFGAFFGQLAFCKGKDFRIVPDRLDLFFQNVR